MKDEGGDCSLTTDDRDWNVRQQVGELRAQVKLMMDSINTLNGRYDSFGDKLDKIGQDIRLHIELHKQREELMKDAATDAASKTAAATAMQRTSGDWARWDRQLSFMRLSGLAGLGGMVVAVALFGLNLIAHHYGLL